MKSLPNGPLISKNRLAVFAIAGLVTLFGAASIGCGDSDNTDAQQGEDIGKTAEEEGVSTGQEEAQQGEQTGEQDAKKGEAIGDKYKEEYGN